MNVMIALQEETCCNCSTHFAIDGSLRARLQERGGIFYCPNGHAQHYTETEVSKLKKQNQSLESRVLLAERQAECAKKDRTVLKSQLTKTRNRIANGVCPCCNRTFVNLARHMSNKHAEFKEVVS